MFKTKGLKRQCRTFRYQADGKEDILDWRTKEGSLTTASQSMLHGQYSVYFVKWASTWKMQSCLYPRLVKIITPQPSALVTSAGIP